MGGGGVHGQFENMIVLETLPIAPLGWGSRKRRKKGEECVCVCFSGEQITLLCYICMDGMKLDSSTRERDCRLIGVVRLQLRKATKEI